MDVFWVKEPRILIDKYWNIIPTNNMNRVEQLNAISRFIIYLMVLLLIFGGDKNLLIYCLLGLILIIIIYFVYSTNEKDVTNDLIKSNKDEYNEYFDNKLCNTCSTNNINNAINDVYDNYKNDNYKRSDGKNVEIQSGYIDFDANYKLGKDKSEINLEKFEKSENEKTKKVSYDENEEYKNRTCKIPTVENPFMNVTFSDYQNGNITPQPCNTNDKNIQKVSQQLYNSSIFRSVGDVFERENSQRNFYTPPIKITPESQENFANWLYKRGPSCKERTSSCAYYEEPYMTSMRY